MCAHFKSTPRIEGLLLPSSFAAKLQAAFAKYGQLCVGIDPHASLLDDWGLTDDVDGLRKFSLTTLDAAVGLTGIIKPQVSFFERFGSRGFQVLEELAVAAKGTDLVVIMDAKRGDIGSTMDGYSQAWLANSAPFVCDALTLSPYLGFDSLLSSMSTAVENGKGLFLLSATSNPEGKTLQRAMVDGHSVSADILSKLENVNRVNLGAGETLGNFGAVVGATVNLQAAGLGNLHTDSNLLSPILAPGFGAQGAELSEMRDLFGAAAPRVIASVSRSILQAGANGIASAIRNANRQLLAG